jgi:hypothetical protein
MKATSLELFRLFGRPPIKIICSYLDIKPVLNFWLYEKLKLYLEFLIVLKN